MEILKICFGTFISYVVLVISLRVMGKREIGQLNLFDLIILLSIADIMIIGIENYNENWLNSLIPVVLLTILQKIVALILLKFSNLRELIDGNISCIIIDGRICIKEMKKSCYNVEDLLLQLRIKDVYNIEDVEYAFLETNGTLSVFPKSNKKTYPIPVIVSGKINRKIIKIYQLDYVWVMDYLGKNHLKLKHIKCAYYDGNTLKIINDSFDFDEKKI